MACVPQAVKCFKTKLPMFALLCYIEAEFDTLTGMQGYSGQVAATASAPSVFVQ